MAVQAEAAVAAPHAARGKRRRGQLGWPRAFPVAQFPNPPLLLAFAGSSLAALADEPGHDVGRATPA